MSEQQHGERWEEAPEMNHDTIQEAGRGTSCTVLLVQGKDGKSYALSWYRRGFRSLKKATSRVSSYRATEDYWRSYFNSPAHQIVPPSSWRIDQGKNGRYYITQIQPFIKGCGLFGSYPALRNIFLHLPEDKRIEALNHIGYFLRKLRSMPLHPIVSGGMAEIPEITGPRNALLDLGGNVSIVDMNNALLMGQKRIKHLRNKMWASILALLGPLTVRSAYTHLLSTYIRLRREFGSKA